MTSYPENPAPTDHPVTDLIAKRWSPMAFSTDPIEESQIMQLFEAARWAPSSFNGQPWRYIYATQDNAEDFEKLGNLLMEGNGWAKNAYMLVVICAAPTFEYNGKPNRHWHYDTGAATQSLFLQATDMGLIGHEMAGFDWEGANKALDLPEEVEAIAMMAIGHPGNPEELSEDLKKRQSGPRERKKISEFAFKGKWQA